MYMYLTERSFGYPISYQADINKPNMGDFFLKTGLICEFYSVIFKKGGTGHRSHLTFIAMMV